MKQFSHQELLENLQSQNSYFNFEDSQNFINKVFKDVDENYFRSKLVNFDQYPTNSNPNSPMIFVSNHSGMAFPWDAMVFVAKLFDQFGQKKNHYLRPLVAPMLTQTRLMNPYQVNDFWKKFGAVDANTKNFESMMLQNDADLLLYPEGVPGIGKGFKKRYELQRFATSFVRMSLKHNSDIVPVATVNAEFVNPLSFTLKPVNYLSSKIGIPFIPLGPLFFGILVQSWFFYLSLPAKMTYVRGDTIKPYEMNNLKLDEMKISDYRDLTNEVQKKMQTHLTNAKNEYGLHPYQYDELKKKFLQRPTFFIMKSPVFWPFLFNDYSECSDVEKKDYKFSFFRILKRQLSILMYYIPLIGLLYFLLRGLLGGGKKASQ